MSLSSAVVRFQRLPVAGTVLLTLALVTLLFLIDIATGAEISFSIFYLLPVGLISVAAGRTAVTAVCVCCGVGWGVADWLGGAHYSNPAIPVWNAAMRIMIFLLVAKLLRRNKQSLELSRQAAAVAQVATRMKTDFLANVSHEIRTPLSAMLGVADLIAETRLNQAQSRYVEIFQAEGEHLRRLINDLLDLSKIEAGKLTIEPAPVQIGDLARAIVEIFEPQAQKKGLQMQFTIEPEADRVWAVDRQRVRQVMANLLSNALKFTHVGGISVAIGVRRQGSPTPWLTFSVADTGTGISPERHHHVFRRFEQLGDSDASRLGGSGLGLSITRGLVERMGGTIDFESEPLKGSRFFFALPAEPAESAPSAVSAAPAPKAKPCSSLAGKRILLVEDYKVNQMVFSAYLHELGCQVEVASDGQEGVTAFTRREFDLILMDIQMPVLDGWSATREIRTLERAGGRKQTPIIALTASALTGDHERCLAAGCTAFLQKPVRKAEMIESVERLISLAEENSPTPIRGGAGPPYDAVIESLRPEFIEELGATILRIRASFAAADYGESGRCAHQLVGAGATFGFPEVTRIGRLLEQAAQRGDRTESLALADQLETIWQTIKQ